MRSNQNRVILLSFLILSAPLFLHAQSQPAAWDQFQIVTRAQTWLYSIEFYRGVRMDSIRIINLKDTSKRAYSRLEPISSLYEIPREVAIQIGALLRASDKKIPKDSIIWSNGNEERLYRALDILRAAPRPGSTTAPIQNKDNSKKDPAVSPAIVADDKSGASKNNASDSAVSALVKKIDTLKAGIDSAKARLDTVNKNLVAAMKADSISKVKEKDSAKEELDSGSNFYITFLNAANFDFSGKLSTSYLGHFGIFAPQAFGKKFGFLTGIEKITYANGILGNDTAQIEYFTQNIVRPNDYNKNVPPPNNVRDSAVYHHQFSKYTFKSSNTAWSYYIEPLWLVKSLKKQHSDHNVGIYIHAHGELFMNVWSRTQTSTILADTQLVYTVHGPNDVNSSPIVRDQPSGPITGNKTVFSGYFGVGPTFFLNPFRNMKMDSSSRFFFQVTIGAAINAPNFSVLTNQQYPLNPNGTYEFATSYSKLKAFYLVKAHFIHNLSSSSQIIIGFLIRDLLPSENPQYAAFIGLNVSLPGLLKLISGN